VAYKCKSALPDLIRKGAQVRGDLDPTIALRQPRCDRTTAALCILTVILSLLELFCRFVLWWSLAHFLFLDPLAWFIQPDFDSRPALRQPSVITSSPRAYESLIANTAPAFLPTSHLRSSIILALLHNVSLSSTQILSQK
jgi:hypothetical protein